MKKFVASYSGGKDSILAIHRAIKQGYEPIQLITTYNTSKNRSWFHGLTENVVEKVSDSLGIPIHLIKTSGEDYAENFEKALLNAKQMGAEFCVFGDIDIEEHLQWCTDRCENAGISACFPLWNENRKSLVYQLIEEGYKAKITIVNTEQLSEEFIGKVLTKEVVNLIEEYGADACGENGEYHTFVYDGPIFNKEIIIKTSQSFSDGNYKILPLILITY